MKILSPVTGAIMRREWRATFGHPTAYVFIVFFALACALGLFRDVFFKNNEVSLESLNAVFPWLLVVYIPAVTMGLWSNERRHGTDELLLTLPAYSQFEFGATNLSRATERLRHDFFVRWMRDPRRVDPANRMPVYADEEGYTRYDEVLDGVAEDQFRAIWLWMRSL